MLYLSEFNKSQLADLSHGRLINGPYYDRQQALAKDLRMLGAVSYDLHLPETRTLPLVIQPNEQLTGIVYGRYVFHRIAGDITISRGALVSTNDRVLLINKKPFYVTCEEIKYDAVSGVTYSRVGPVGHVVLHNKLGDIDLRTFNQHCAQNFTRAIETALFNYKEGGVL